MTTYDGNIKTVPARARSKRRRSAGVSGSGSSGTVISTTGNGDVAASADYATEAGQARQLTTDSTDWAKILRKDIADTAAGIITFAAGLVSSLRARFHHGITVDMTQADASDTDTLALNVTGDAKVDGDMDLEGNFETHGSVNSFENDVTMASDLDVAGTSKTQNMTVTKNESVSGNSTIGGTLGVTGKGTLGSLGVTGNATVAGSTALEETTFGSFLLGSSGAKIYKDTDSSGNVTWWLEIDFLHIRKKLTAETVEIMHTQHIGGQLILSAASCTAASVTAALKSSSVIDYYHVTFRTTDSDGNTISNMWKVGDLAYCKTFGVSSGSLSSHYYWRKVTGVGDGYINLAPNTIGGAGTLYATGSDAPLAGDYICQLGYMGTDDASRQNAIVLSSVGVPGTVTTMPVILQYTGISTFSLPSPDTKISPGDNIFTGVLRMRAAGGSVFSTLDSALGFILGQNVTTDPTSWKTRLDLTGGIWAEAAKLRNALVRGAFQTEFTQMALNKYCLQLTPSTLANVSAQYQSAGVAPSTFAKRVIVMPSSFDGTFPVGGVYVGNDPTSAAAANGAEMDGDGYQVNVMGQVKPYGQTTITASEALILVSDPRWLGDCETVSGAQVNDSLVYRYKGASADTEMYAYDPEFSYFVWNGQRSRFLVLHSGNSVTLRGVKTLVAGHDGTTRYAMYWYVENQRDFTATTSGPSMIVTTKSGGTRTFVDDTTYNIRVQLYPVGYSYAMALTVNGLDSSNMLDVAET